MRSQIPQQSATAITVFYPSNPLMHQVSGWAIRYPDREIVPFFVRALPVVRRALRYTAIAIVDATEDPVAAMAALVEAVAALETTCVAAYSEEIHEGLELFVRARGALLLLGPTSDAQWEAQIETMLQSADRMQSSGHLARRHAAAGGGFPEAEPLGHRFQTAFSRRSSRFLA